MMKRYLLYSIIILMVVMHVFCNQQQSSGAVKKVERDLSITPENAYSNLFMDSLMLEKFIASEVTSDSIAMYMRNFYNSRNYSFAWFDENGLTVQAEGFWNAHNQAVRQKTDTSIVDNALHKVVDTLLNSDSTVDIDKDVIELTELRYTHHFFEYVQYAYGAKVDPGEVQWHIPRRKVKPIELLDSFLSSKSGNWKEPNKAYSLLQDKLVLYRDIEQKGGWTEIDKTKKKLKNGDKDSIVLQVKKRLEDVGLYTQNDQSITFDNALEDAVKQAEASFQLKTDGVVDRELVEELNVPVSERIKQMLINLERMKWMPDDADNYLFANIPEYRLHVIEDGKEKLAMNIVVGKAANRTVIFSDVLKYVVFSPYWNIPKSIVRNEIYPAMQRSSSYLDRKNMEVTGYNDGLPVIRQKPGGSNALGRVKFIFPNRYNIYFHDTPSKSLFKRQERAFSHGCIRLQQPFELAEYLLRDQPVWTSSKINSAMYSNSEKWVTLKEPVPVYIAYFTSWVDKDGLLHFANDLYGHDKRMAAHLFQ